MSELTVVNQDGKLLISSRDVAEMVEKDHGHLLRDIQTYIKVLGQSNLGVSNFFIESKYLSAQNKSLTCYLLTKEGCDMVANKMIGAKGILFTATYVLKFKEMEAAIANKTQIPMCIEDMMIHQLESMKEVRAELGSVNSKLELITSQIDSLNQVVYAPEPSLQIEAPKIQVLPNWYRILDSGIFDLLNSKEYYLEGIGKKGRTRCNASAIKLGYVRTVASGTAVFILPSVLRKGLTKLGIDLPLGYKYLVEANIVIPGANSITKVLKIRGGSERLLHFNLQLHPDIIAVERVAI